MLDLNILQGDCREKLKDLPDASVHCCVTSPPYFGLRDYGVPWQIGLESSPDEYVSELVDVFREVRRVLRDDGTLWLNLGDSYCASPPGNAAKGVSGKSTLNGVNSDRYRETLEAGHATKRDTSRLPGLKPKDLIGIPWRVAFALQADGWYLRSDIIWAKPNPMPESVTDRPTKSHEYLFLLSKSDRYFYDQEAIKEKGAGRELFGNSRRLSHQDRKDCSRQDMTLTDARNRRSVWTVATSPYPEAHFATYPPELIKPCILAGCPAGGVVLDPFAGSGTTGKVALELGRSAILIELNPDYVKLIEKRCRVNLPLMFEAVA
jgi:DNA modification methylase